MYERLLQWLEGESPLECQWAAWRLFLQHRDRAAEFVPRILDAFERGVLDDTRLLQAACFQAEERKLRDVVPVLRRLADREELFFVLPAIGALGGEEEKVYLLELLDRASKALPSDRGAKPDDHSHATLVRAASACAGLVAMGSEAQDRVLDFASSLKPRLDAWSACLSPLLRERGGERELRLAIESLFGASSPEEAEDLAELVAQVCEAGGVDGTLRDLDPSRDGARRTVSRWLAAGLGDDGTAWTDRWLDLVARDEVRESTELILERIERDLAHSGPVSRAAAERLRLALDLMRAQGATWRHSLGRVQRAAGCLAVSLLVRLHVLRAEPEDPATLSAEALAARLVLPAWCWRFCPDTVLGEVARRGESLWPLLREALAEGEKSGIVSHELFRMLGATRREEALDLLIERLWIAGASWPLREGLVEAVRSAFEAFGAGAGGRLSELALGVREEGVARLALASLGDVWDTEAFERFCIEHVEPLCSWCGTGFLDLVTRSGARGFIEPLEEVYRYGETALARTLHVLHRLHGVTGSRAERIAKDAEQLSERDRKEAQELLDFLQGKLPLERSTPLHRVHLRLRCRDCGRAYHYDVEDVQIELGAAEGKEDASPPFWLDQKIRCKSCGAIDRYALTREAMSLILDRSMLLLPLIEKLGRPRIGAFSFVETNLGELDEKMLADPSAALGAMKAELGARPESRTRLLLLARYLRRLRRYDEALSALEALRESDPENLEAMVQEVALLAYLERHADAYEKGIRAAEIAGSGRVGTESDRGGILDLLLASLHESAAKSGRTVPVDVEQRIRRARPAEIGRIVAASEADLRRIERSETDRGASPASRVGRNDPCPCGSGRKFKKCCGRIVA